jgi:imidazolonepropionase-like amidohydrolase
MTFLERGAEIGAEFSRGTKEVDLIKRNLESSVNVLETARSLGVKVLCGTDSGNSPLMPYGELHANEADILVRYGRYSPMEAIVANTQGNAFAVGLEDEVGVIAPGMLADIIILNEDPVADITVLKGGRHLTTVIKDGKEVDLNGGSDASNEQLTL